MSVITLSVYTDFENAELQCAAGGRDLSAALLLICVSLIHSDSSFLVIP